MNILLKITRFLDLKSIFIVFGVLGRFFLQIIQKWKRKKFTNRPGKLEKNVS